MSLPWMNTAESLIGVERFRVDLRHHPDEPSNPQIISWAEALGGYAAKYYQHDDIPWCGLFIAHCMSENGLMVPKNPLSALEYGNWGQGLSEPSVGAVMVFTRNGGGHVGFYLGEDDEEAYHILGGNQNNMVCRARVSKSRLHSIRWPSDYDLQYTGPVQLSADDDNPSTNEQ